MSITDNTPYLETIPIQLRPGLIERAADKIIFATRDGRGRALLPARCEVYVNALSRVTDLETLILDHLARGQTVDYRLLKTTVLALFHGNCIANSGDLRPYIEAWQQPPLQEPALITALARSRPARTIKGMEVFIAALAALGFWIFLLTPLASQFFSDQVRLLSFALLSPGAMLSIQSLGIWLLDHMAGSASGDLGGRLSPLGLHIESDAKPYRTKPIAALVTAAVLSLALPLISIRMGASITSGKVGGLAAIEFLENMTLILMSLTLFPGLRGPLSLARAELMKRGKMRGHSANPAMNGAFIAASVVGLCASFGVIAESVINMIQLVMPPFSVYALGGITATLLTLVPFAWSILLVTDLLSAVESMADDIELFDPVRSQLEILWTRLRDGRPRGDQQRIQNALGGHPLFQSLPADLRDPLALAARLMTTSAGSRLIRQGSRTTDLYLLISGSVGVYKRDPETRDTELVLRLGPGSVFGEAGFFLDQARTADIVTLERTQLVRIPRPAAFRPNEKDAAHDVFRKKIWASQVLSSHSLFQSLPSEAVLHVLNFSEVVTIPTHGLIMREGEPSDSLWLLVQGTAAISVRGTQRPDAKKGDVLGEIGLIWNSARTATVLAREECVCLKLGAPAFRTLVSRNLNFGARLQDIGSKRLEQDRQEIATKQF